MKRLLFLLFTACASTRAITPIAEHHAHLVSPAAAIVNSETPLPAVSLPEDLAQLLRARGEHWNDANALRELYAEDAILLDPDDPVWIRGREKVADYVSTRFARAYTITPVAFGPDFITGYFTRPAGYFGHVHFSLRNNRIAAETFVFPGPYTRAPVTAEQLIAQLDEAHIRYAAILSVAYWFGSPLHPPIEDEYAKTRAENDWTIEQVSKYPDRLAAFCSFNPLKGYAVAELERCAMNPLVKGIKLHFGNSGVDVRKPEQMEKVRAVFRAANEHRLAIVAHLWTDPSFEKEGEQHAKIFLDQLLPAAPEVVVQIAHMAGGGMSTDRALAVFADAIAAHDPRARNLYFDVATLTTGQTSEGLAKDAMRMRQIGMHRILYGTDTVPPNAPARESWSTFRARMPLTDGELRTIANNVAPYFRERR